MKDGRETGSLKEHRNGEPSALKGARTGREGALRNVPKGNALAAYFTVFISQRRFTRPAMEIEGDHIGGGEGALRQIGPAEFIHDAVAHESDLPLIFFFAGAGWVATKTRTSGPLSERRWSGQSESARQVPLSALLRC